MKRIIKCSVIILFCFSFPFVGVQSYKENNFKNTDVQYKLDNYTIRDYNGQVAIFKGNEKTPIQIFDIYTNSLPAHESASIIKGIQVKSEYELQKLIEAYLS